MIFHKNKNSVSKRILIIPLLIILLLTTLCVGVYASSGSIFGWKPFSQKSESTQGDNPASDEQIETGNSIKEKSLNNGGASGSDQPQAPTEQSDGKQLVQVDITNVYTIETSTKVSVLISAIDSTGVCTIKVSSQSGSLLYSSSSDVQAMSSTSTCKGFDLPNSLIQNKYSITVDFTSGNKYGTATYDNF